MITKICFWVDIVLFLLNGLLFALLRLPILLILVSFFGLLILLKLKYVIPTTDKEVKDE